MILSSSEWLAGLGPWALGLGPRMLRPGTRAPIAQACALVRALAPWPPPLGRVPTAIDRFHNALGSRIQRDGPALAADADLGPVSQKQLGPKTVF